MPHDIKEVHDQQSDSGSRSESGKFNPTHGTDQGSSEKKNKPGHENQPNQQPPKKTFTARNTNIGKRETSKSPQFANFCGHSPANLPKWKGVQGRHPPVI